MLLSEFYLTDTKHILIPSYQVLLQELRLTNSEFKKKICFEKYLSANVDRSILAKFTKLRISNHRLEVEVGRYARTAKQLRLCKTCNLKAIEDEFHFICICKTYDDLRKQLFKDMSSIVPNFDNFCLYDKFGHDTNCCPVCR